MSATGGSGAVEVATEALADRRFAARGAVALVVANGRYWRSVAPVVRKELQRWQIRADTIDDPELRALALSKLDGESFHAEAAAMLATFAPRAHRSSAVEAIVALELMFDYLDGLTELPSRDPLREGDRLFEALRAAVAVPRADTRDRVEQRLCNDGGYLDELSRAVSAALARLPGAATITEVAQRIASRSGEAQTRMHAATQLGIAQLEEWGRSESRGGGVEWRELVVGSASSVLVLHALIAAAADPATTSWHTKRLAEAYLSTCVLLTLLDGLIDHDEDKDHEGLGRPGYLSLFEVRDELPKVLGQAARRAASQARRLPNGAHHVMLLTGVVAYYSSAPGAEGELARPVIARLRHELAPLMPPTLRIMQAWRGARRRLGPLRTKLEGKSHDATPPRRELYGRQGVVDDVSQSPSTQACRGISGAALSALALIVPTAVTHSTPASAISDRPSAKLARVLNVRDEGRLRYVKSAGSVIIDEGRASGTFPGSVKVRFSYDGEPTVSASFTISGPAGSISARGTARLSSPMSQTPSFHGTMTITGGSGRYAHVHGRGELFGVYYRRNYALTVQAIGRLPY